MASPIASIPRNLYQDGDADGIAETVYDAWF